MGSHLRPFKYIFLKNYGQVIVNCFDLVENVILVPIRSKIIPRFLDIISGVCITLHSNSYSMVNICLGPSQVTCVSANVEELSIHRKRNIVLHFICVISVIKKIKCNQSKYNLYWFGIEVK